MKINFSPTNGRFDIRHPDSSGAIIHGAKAWISYRHRPNGNLLYASVEGSGCILNDEPFSDIHGHGTQNIIRCSLEAEQLELVYRVKNYDDQPFCLLQINLVNLASEPIYLHEFCLFDVNSGAGGMLELGKAAGELKFFKVGWIGWDYCGSRSAQDQNSRGLLERLTRLSYTNPATRLMHKGGEFSSEGWALLADDETCLVTGLVTTAAQFGQVYACIRPGEVAFSIITQMDGVRLDPGEQRDSEWGYLEVVALPHPEPAARYIEVVSQQMAARVPIDPPPVIWTHWYQFYHNISEQRFLDNLEVLNQCRKNFPCQGAELDDGYQMAWGDWTIANSKFPHGLDWLAEKVRENGFLPGLWLAPFAVQSKSELAKKHPDWLVKNQHGKPANAGFLYNMFIHPLDLTNPEVLEHITSLAHRIAHDWGYEMLKVDFLNAGTIPGRRSNPKLTRAESLRLGLVAIREGAGEDTFILGCGCPFGPAIGIVDAMRIGPDTAPSWTPYFHWMGWASPLLKTNPNMPALRNALRNTLNLSSLHKRWWWNDPDCLLVRDTDSRLTEAEVQSALTLVGLSGGLVISSDDLHQVSPERLLWLSKLTPNLGLRGEPLDFMDHDMPGMYRVTVDHNGQTWQLVGLFNWHDQIGDLRLEFGQLGFPAGSKLHIFDFWDEKYHNLVDGEIIFHNIPPHGCKLLRACEVSNAMQVVGDTLHISMGAEILSLRIVNERILIDTVDMGRKVEGKVWVWTGEKVNEIQINNINKNK